MEEIEDNITCRGPCKKVWPRFGRSSFLTHITQAKKCKILYREDEIAEFQKSSYNRKKRKIIEKQKETYDENVKNKKLKTQRKTYDENVKNKKLKRQRKENVKTKILKQKRSKYDPVKAKEKYKNKPSPTMKQRITKFKHECKYGPLFVCVCCMRLLFKRGARKITYNYELMLFGSGMIDHLQTENIIQLSDSYEVREEKLKFRRFGEKQKKMLKESLKVHGAHHLCNNCCTYLEKMEMPPCCAKNSLEYHEIPDSLKLSNLERQLICKDLVFIKIRQLYPTNMDSMNDRVINVAIEDDDIIKTVTSLPRTQKNNGMITVGLKRDTKYDRFHKLQMVRPEKLYEALLYLKDNHSSYKDIIIPSLNAWKKEYENSDKDNDKSTAKETTGDSVKSSGEEMSDAETDQGNEKLQINESEENIFNSTTCLFSENPLADVVVNTSDKPLRKATKRNSDLVHIVAPGQRKKLSYWLTEEDHDINAFPDLFPNGKCGLNDPERQKKITPGQNYSQKSLNIDSRFGQDADFIFVAQQSLEKHRFESQISISCQRGAPMKGGDGLKSNNAIDVFKDIPGTPPYWKKVRNDLFARMEQLGQFHFFFTLSAAEMKWSEVTTSILHTLGCKITYDPGWENDETKIKIDKMPLPEYKKKIRNKSEFFKKHFLLITRIFDNRVKAFISLLKATGKVDNYTYRIEFQLRGMPHLHGVFWLTKEEINPCKNENGEYIDEKLIELTDRWVSCSLDTGDKELDKLVQKFNCHDHKKSCYKGKSVGCRFNFPRFPSDRTLIAHPISSDLNEDEKKLLLKQSRDVLNKVRNKLEEISDEDIDNLNNSLDIFLEELGIDKEVYEKALGISERGKVAILKRKLKERYVNNYNQEFMLAWRANIDIQFCYDGYGCVTYLTDYVTKADAAVTKALQEAISNTKGCDDLERLNVIKRAYFTKRQVSTAEAVYRLVPGLSLTASSVKSRFVGTGFLENRSGFYKKVYDDNDGDVDDDDDNDIASDDEDDIEEDDMEMDSGENFEVNGCINIPGREGKFKKMAEIHGKYSNRPKYLENMCLAQFATTYDYVKKPAKIIFQEGISQQIGCLEFFGSDTKVPKYIKLNSGGYMQSRNSPFILRIHSSKKKKGDEGKYSELLLYFPWRIEKELRANFNETFNTNYNIIERNKTQIYPNSNMIDEMRDILENNDDTRPRHLLEDINPAGEQDNLENQELMEPLDTSVLPDEEPIPINVKSSGLLFRKVEVDEHDVMLESARCLSFEQRIIFDQIVQFCKIIVRYKKGGSVKIVPPNIIATGGGGAGKSHLIRIVSQWTEKILMRQTEPYKTEAYTPKVLLLAFTGSASSLIGGTTVHSGLGFKYGADYPHLRKENLDKQKKKLEDVEVVIVDEMSMISSDFLFNINQRMKDLFDCQDEFGGRALLLAGDLLQLPPVNGTAIFKKPRSTKNKNYFNIESTENTPGGNLWANCQVVYLKTNFRQGLGNPWTELLNRVRIGEPINEDKAILLARRLSLLDYEQQKKAAHVYFKNNDVMNYNKKMLRTLKTPSYENKARYDIPKGSNFTPPIDKKKGTVGNSNFSEILQLKLGARVMLVYNIDIPDLLVNGALGTLVGLEFDKKGNVECIIVSFDKPETGVNQMKSFPEVTFKYSSQRGCPIYKQTVEELISTSIRRKGKVHGSTYKLTQFPLRLAWGSTAHKVQGIEIKKGSDIVTHGDKKMPDGMYYVMLSRAQSLENVYNDNFLPEKLRANADALEEDGKLHERCVVSSYRNMHYSFFVLNIRSLSKHLIDVCQDMYAERSDHICLVETWIDPAQTNIEKLQLAGRSFDHASLGKGKGCAIFSRYSNFNGKIVSDKYQLLSIIDKEVQLVLVYISKNCPFEELKLDLVKLLKSEKKHVITGDFNFDKDEKNALTKYLGEKDFVQLVHNATHDDGRVIDHCYVPRDIKEKVIIKQHSPYYSDHDALCINLNLI